MRFPTQGVDLKGPHRESAILACLERLSLLGLTEVRRLGQGEENDLLAGDGADVMVQAQDLDASDLVDHRFQDRTGRFDQVGPYLLEQVPPFLGRKRLDQLLFGGGQNPLKADHEEFTQQVGVNVLGSPAHVVLLKLTDSFTNSGFEFSQGLHSDSESTHQRGGLRTKVHTWQRNMNHQFVPGAPRNMMPNAEPRREPDSGAVVRAVWRRSRQPPAPTGILDGLVPILDLEFLDDVMDVVLDGIQRQRKPLGNLLIA